MKTNAFLFLLLFLGMTQVSYSQEKTDSISSENEFFELTEQPSFPGGIKAMMKFISDEVIYPKDAIDNAIEGNVAIQFVVEKDGSIVNINILRDPGGGLGSEAERIVRLMPKWSPAYQKDVPVRVKMVIPIRFKLNKKDLKK